MTAPTVAPTDGPDFDAWEAEMATPNRPYRRRRWADTRKTVTTEAIRVSAGINRHRTHEREM